MAEREETKAGVGLPIGANIGKYEIREKLGVGGQAIIYKCYDELLDRYVAIKQISSHLAEDPRFLERFRREAQILARIGTEQPAVLAIHELITEPGGLFIVMEFVEGQTLETMLATANAPLDANAALQIIWRLAAGLHAVHAAGIVHRDIKPSNIIVTEALRVKITDFGVAASTTGQTSMLLGTTKYMAPEIFESGQVDARADMYSLGFVAYEMFAGRPRFNEIFADVIRDKHSEALRWMKWHGNTRVSAPPLREIAPDIPDILSEIIAKMMTKDPSERFQSMEALGRAIKSSFSPRGRAAAYAAPPLRRPSKAAGDGGAAMRPPGAPVVEEAGFGPGDEAQQLQVTAEGALTAPLPRAGLSLRTKLILAGICAVSVLVIGIILGVKMRRAQLERATTADGLYKQAATAYKEGNYSVALEKFTELHRRFRKTTQGVKASVMRHLALAHIATADRNWAMAKAAEDAAAESAREVQAKHDSLEKWCRRINEDILDFSIARINARIFIEAMEKAHMAVDRKDFDGAESALDAGLIGMRLSPQQAAEEAALRGEITRGRLLSELERLRLEGEDLVKQGRFDEALERYRQAQVKLAEEGKALPDVQREQLRKQLTLTVGEAVNAKEYQKAIDSAEAARARTDKVGELAALRKAVRIRPSRTGETRIRQLESSIALDDGRQLLKDGKFTEARTKYELAVKLNPSDKEAVDELTNLNETIKWRQTVLAAETAFAAGKFAEALAKYQEAAGIRPDAEVDAKITECRFRVELVRGDALRDAKKYDQALAAYEAARKIKPGEAASIEVIVAETRQRQRYDGEITKGDEALAKGMWSKALKYFRKAKEIRPGGEADQRINAARYAEYLAKGKAAMAAGDLRAARAHFKIAKGHRDTKEVDDLIEEVNKKLAE